MRQRRHKNNYILFYKTAIKIGMLMLAVFCLFIFSNSVHAQIVSVADENSDLQQGVKTIEKPLGLPSTDIRIIVANIIRAALGLLGIIMVVLMMYGGFLWMTAGGNDEQIGRAKKVLINAVIGLVIILSAYSIVLFVMKMLGIGGGEGSGGSTSAPPMQHFAGSGALGGIIKDHYPDRDQTGVPRNTKIVVTFRKPILPSSFIEDVNKNGIYGDCTGAMKWDTDCDRITTTIKNGKKVLDNKFINIFELKTGLSIDSAAITVSPSTTINGMTGNFTIVIKPLTSASGGYLGSPSENIGYTVHLGPGILLNDPANSNPSAFDPKIINSNYYEWKFTCANTLDITPPYVKTVYPTDGSTEVKNTIIQVDFSEAMDPTGIQGGFVLPGSSVVYYEISNGHIYLISANSKMPQGDFNLVNGYRTLEFTSTIVCGTNACGGKIYCLPVCDNVGSSPGACAGNPKKANYQMLLKAAQTLTTSSFESVAFSGVMDLAGNALDSNQNNIVDKSTANLKGFPVSTDPDNYYWDFDIKDEMDLTSPYIRKVTPGLDAENVSVSQELSMDFSKRMSFGSMYNITITESPAPPGGVPLWIVPRSNNTSTPSLQYTTTEIRHGSFLNDKAYYYMPLAPSTVEDLHYNCLYPGKGPNQSSNTANKSSAGICDESNQGNCCAVTSSTEKSVCCNGAVSNSTTACINKLKK